MATDNTGQVPTGLQGMGKETGTIGLKMNNGVVVEEAHAALQWPKSLDTYNRMSYDPAISSANNTIRAFVRKATYTVKYPEGGETESHKAQIDFIKTLMKDMDTTFADVMGESMSFLKYGFAVHEKVFKYRNDKGKFKSKYSDGKIGWAKLPIRSQDSIYRWHFDEFGRDLTAVEQNLNMVSHNYSIDGEHLHTKFGKNGDGRIKIARKKFMHIRHNTERNNPEGTSPMKACYIPWMYKARIEEFQAIGISRDMGGLPVIYLPPEYMSEDAPDDKKAFYLYCQDIINNLQANEQAGMIFPKFVDEHGNDLFTFTLESVNGGKMYDTATIISGYENKILMTYLADVLKLGQDASGSFALSDNKTNLLAVGIQAIVDEVLQEYNRDLIPQTMQMNGFPPIDGEYPHIVLDELDEVDIAVLAKAIQQFAAVGALEVDQNLSDFIRDTLKIPEVDRSKPIAENMIGGGMSKSGEGSKTSGNGTASSPSAKNTTTASTSNK